MATVQRVDGRWAAIVENHSAPRYEWRGGRIRHSFVTSAVEFKSKMAKSRNSSEIPGQLAQDEPVL
jgi:hypothetical protein